MCILSQDKKSSKNLPKSFDDVATGLFVKDQRLQIGAYDPFAAHDETVWS